MRKLFLFCICLFASLAWVNGAKAEVWPRGPAVEQGSTTGPSASQAPIGKLLDSIKNLGLGDVASSTPQGNATSTDKQIIVNLANQDLTYLEGTRVIGEFKISSGLRRTPTPPGEYTVLQKKPLVDYKGLDYNFSNTKWNLMFKKGKALNFYIHGAYWHHNFGHPMSHGCINVSYANMEPLYNWADVGTKITIQ